ncbi:MAG: GGDEF domain-containing protein [Rhodanobacteraceae bacterium]|nr:MAG: GGDEF domain-containing protein [Rhodanobacteraceae bacterium]
MIIWLPVLWIATGVCLFAGMHFLRAGHTQEDVRLFHAFGILCLAVAAYIGVSALLQAPVAGTPSVRLERLHITILCLVFPAAVWFMALYSRLQRWQPWVLASVAVFGALLGLNLAGPHSLLLAEARPLAPMVLPWGERVAQITGITAPLAPAFYAATLGVFCWAFWRCLALWKRGDATRARPLAAYLILQLAATGYSEYTMLRPRPTLDWDALPFLVLVLLLSRTLNLELRSYAVALDASNAALREENGLRDRAEAKLRQMAYNDAISGLPNRHALSDRLAAILATAPLPHGALVVIDPQRFEVINHALGHRTGDLLIRELGNRLSRAVAGKEFVARLSGDEFAAVLFVPATDAATALAQALHRAEELHEALAHPWQVGASTLSINTHMGLVMFDEAGGNGDTLLRQAYAALHAAKAAGRNEPTAFTQAMQAQAERRMRIEVDLHAAIANQQLHLVYQPQVDRGGSLVGAEALLRWDHPAYGTVNPAEFVAIAEDSGQMPALGLLVLRMAFSTLARLPSRGSFRLSINVSPWQLFLADFLETMQMAIREAAVDPRRVMLEITETALIHDIPDAVAKLQALVAIGIQVSIDDFGTGYASVARLKTLPVHELKIDQAFIRDMSVTTPDRFVAALIGLGDAMHLRVVAEGVEREDQRDALIRMGCDALQGYLISRPIPADALAEWMQ